jgi:beta-galactosidase
MMHHPTRYSVRTIWRAALLLSLFCAVGGRVSADDGIFPPAPAAKASIDFDGRGFLLGGKRTFLVSGSLHYSRVPRALWRDRLLRIKRAGFNTVQTYAFWNYHEAQEGKWNFTGDHDFEAFLKLVKEMGLYAVVRPGPYVCAEWDSGGYPVWLRFKPGVRVRQDNPEFIAAVDAWYDHILPIIARNQIHRGGAVIMVQLENEHPQGWGREMPNGYFRHLREKALALGIEVPYFFSGLHHGSDPAGNRPWDSKGRSNPWYSTEFWPGWYDLYGPLNAGRLRYFDRGAWKILAYGGNGYNFYMLHGGTDFDTTNDDEVASSYDYGAAIGQAGDLRPIYYRFKKAALFARSFADVLEDSENATDEYKDFAPDSGLRVTARKSQAGTIVFLDNNTDQGVYWQNVRIAPGEIMPVVRDYKLAPGVTLLRANLHILGISRQGNLTTLVVYGSPAPQTGAVGEPPQLHFALSGKEVLVGSNNAGFDPAHRGEFTVTPTFGPKGAHESFFTVDNQRIRVLAVNEKLADYTWFVEAGGNEYVIGGPAYVGDVEEQNGKLGLIAEQPVGGDAGAGGDAPADLGSFVYGPEAQGQMLKPGPVVLPNSDPQQLTAPALSDWQVRRGDAESAPGYPTINWKASPEPLPMGADGDDSAYAWYRAILPAARAGKYNLVFSDGGDWLTVFVNGKPAGSSRVQQRLARPVPRTIPVTLQAGRNTIAVLAAHYGRQKLFNFLGPIGLFDAKGINGAVTLMERGGVEMAITNWRTHAAAGEEPAAPMVDIGSDPSWSAVHIGDDAFNGRRGFLWYRATLDNAPGPRRVLHFENVDDNATVWLNGKKLLHHEGWGQPFDAPLDAAWNPNGPNQVAVLVENTDGAGGIMGSVTLQAGLPVGGTVVRAWKMRGGLGDVAGKPADWRPWTGAKPAGVPTFYRSEFTYTRPSATRLVSILRVSVRDLSRGFVWLNGHNLGRYPEKVPVDGLYLPEPWLKPGKNSLLIFDEEGKAPANVAIVVERAASRIISAQTAVPATAQTTRQ